MTYKQVAEMTGLSIQTLYRLVKTNRIPHIKLRKRAKFTVLAVFIRHIEIGVKKMVKQL